MTEDICHECAGTLHAGDDVRTCLQCGKPWPVDAEDCTVDKVLFVPFRVTEEACHEALLRWLVPGQLIPDDILHASELVFIEAAYLPFYVFFFAFDVDWTAHAGYDRTEHYTELEERWEREPYQAIETVPDLQTVRHGNEFRPETVMKVQSVTKYQSVQRHYPVTRQRTEVDWYPTSGSLKGKERRVAVAAFTEVADEHQDFCFAGLEHCPEAETTGPIASAHTALKPFALTPTRAWENPAEALIEASIEAECEGEVPGNRARSVRWKGEIRRERIAALYLPYWFVTYSYAGKLYTCAIDGYDVERITGERPTDQKREADIKEQWEKIQALTALEYGGCGTALCCLGIHHPQSHRQCPR